MSQSLQLLIMTMHSPILSLNHLYYPILKRRLQHFSQGSDQSTDLVEPSAVLVIADNTNSTLMTLPESLADSGVGVRPEISHYHTSGCRHTDIEPSSPDKKGVLWLYSQANQLCTQAHYSSHPHECKGPKQCPVNKGRGTGGVGKKSKKLKNHIHHQNMYLREPVVDP